MIAVVDYGVNNLASVVRALAAAGHPDDEQSQRALTYLQAELARKRNFLTRL